MEVEKPREIAFRALQRREKGDLYIEQAVDLELSRSAITSADRGLAQELAYGVIRWQAMLDWLISRKTSGRAQKAGLQNLLRLGLYQLFWLERIPDHAAVHETVELGKRVGFGSQAGFLNAVLRGYTREKAKTQQTIQALQTDQPALGYSHPAWLAERWQQRWGLEAAAKLMQWNNTPPKLFARVNTLLIDAGKLLTGWRERESVEYDFFLRDWTGENLVFEVKSSPPISSLPSFRQGHFYVQDPSTLLAVQSLEPKPGETVLDLCAAPGGKCTFAAQLMNNEGRIVAEDVDEARVSLLRENCQRLGVTCADIRLLSGETEPAQVDRVLVDAPCSNTGVMRRRVDLRWRIQPEEINRLQRLQLELLERASRRLRPGGVLVYSTCSIEPEENDQVVQRFVDSNPEFTLGRQRQLLPFQDGVDGAYVALLKRRDQ